MEDPAALLDRLPEADRARLQAGLAASARAEGTWRDELRVDSPEGSVRWVQASASARTDGAGLLWDGVVVDVTPIKEAEQSLRESERQLRSLSAHLERAKETERTAVAREVHDEIGGTLTAMKADLASLQRRLGGDEAAAERLASLEGLVARAMATSQAISRRLRPSLLDQGLYHALAAQGREFEARHGIACKVVANDEDLQLDEERATALFRIGQEALTNVAKHSGARAVELNLFASAAQVSLEVRDDGRGVDPAHLDKTGSYGDVGMHERVRNLGGWLEIDGGPGRGTTIMVTLPRPSRREGPA
jgi:signal transduction histidine kinase